MSAGIGQTIITRRTTPLDNYFHELTFRAREAQGGVQRKRREIPGDHLTSNIEETFLVIVRQSTRNCRSFPRPPTSFLSKVRGRSCYEVYFVCNKITVMILNDRGPFGKLGHPRPYNRAQARGLGEGVIKLLHEVTAL